MTLFWVACYFSIRVACNFFPFASLAAAHTVSPVRVGVHFLCFGFFWYFLVLGLQEGRKQGRKQQPGRIGRKEGKYEGGQEGRKKGRREGRKEGRKEGTVFLFTSALETLAATVLFAKA